MCSSGFPRVSGTQKYTKTRNSRAITPNNINAPLAVRRSTKLRKELATSPLTRRFMNSPTLACVRTQLHTQYRARSTMNAPMRAKVDINTDPCQCTMAHTKLSPMTEPHSRSTKMVREYFAEQHHVYWTVQNTRRAINNRTCVRGKACDGRDSSSCPAGHAHAHAPDTNCVAAHEQAQRTQSDPCSAPRRRRCGQRGGQNKQGDCNSSG